MSRIAAVGGLAIAILAGAAGPAAAAPGYYNTYTTVGDTPNTSCCTGVQGFAAGATYLYSIKTRTDYDDVAVIYRVNKFTGTTVLMKNGTSGGTTNTWLRHGNDMTIVDIATQHYMLIVTMSTSGYQVVKLKYVDDTYTLVAQYYVRLGGVAKAVSGIHRIQADTSQGIQLFFKDGSTIYQGTVAPNAPTGTVIALEKPFNLQVSGALVDSKPVTNPGPITTFANQGFFYDETKKVIYYPLTNANVSIVLVYRNVTRDSTGTVPAATDLSFRITSSAYTKFEIEGVGISGGQLYFSTNRSNSSGSYDGVHVFNGYLA